MKYPYDVSYQPPFPVVRVVLCNGEEGLRSASAKALLRGLHVCYCYDGP